MTDDERRRESFCVVPLEKVVVNPYQPRNQFSQQSLQELADSIRSVGILYPPLVRKREGHYELISGERRYRAAQLAGLEEIPILVREAVCSESAQAALIENLHREDLNPIEVAGALSRLRQDFGYTQEQLSTIIGKPRSTIANFLRLLTLPEGVKRKIVEGLISLGHAKVLLSVEGEALRYFLLEKILKEKLSVRELEEKVAQRERKKRRSRKLQKLGDCYLEELERRLQKYLGTKVKVEAKRQGGSIQIDYYNLDDLDRVLDCLGLSDEEEQNG